MPCGGMSGEGDGTGRFACLFGNQHVGLQHGAISMGYHVMAETYTFHWEGGVS